MKYLYVWFIDIGYGSHDALFGLAQSEESAKQMILDHVKSIDDPVSSVEFVEHWINKTEPLVLNVDQAFGVSMYNFLFKSQKGENNE